MLERIRSAFRWGAVPLAFTLLSGVKAEAKRVSGEGAR